MKILSTFIIFCAIATSFLYAQDSSDCPVPCGGGEVDLYRYAGEWRDYQQSRNNIFHFGIFPTSYWYKPVNGTSTAVVTSYSTIKKEYDTTILADAFNNGHNLGMNFELPVLGNLYREYYIRTDYDNYSLAWNCVKENNTRDFFSTWRTIRLFLFFLLACSVLYANVFLRGDEPKVDIEEIKRRVFGEMGMEVPLMDQVDRRGCPPFSERSLL